MNHTTGELTPQSKVLTINETLFKFIPVLKVGVPVVYCIVNSEINEEEARANAKLIAVAHELLEVARRADELCKLITKWANAEQDDSYSIMDAIVDMAQDDLRAEKVIQKATE